MTPHDEAEALEIDLLLEAIQRRYGYDFRDYTRDSVRRRALVGLRNSGCAHFGELQHRVLHEPEAFARLFECLTVQVSEMFRDPSFYRLLRERVIPLLRTYPQLKIWHAGCASGEEVYTTAILLSEENLYERTQIYATDVSQKALEQAREGVYAQERVNCFSQNYLAAGGKGRLEDYFSFAYGRMGIRESLRRQVVFFQHDLVSDYALGEMQVIFCRNVLIYFGAALRERVLSMFRGGLCPGGFLCLGRSESLPGSLRNDFNEFSLEERVYRLGASA